MDHSEGLLVSPGCRLRGEARQADGLRSEEVELRRILTELV